MVFLLVLENIHHIARKEFGISVFLDADLLQHLAYDHLDMLIIDLNTLQTVYTLNLVQHVILYCADTFDLQDIVWVYRTFGQDIAGFQNRSVTDLDTGSIRDQVSFGHAFLRICHNNLAFLLGILDRCDTFELGDDCKSLRLSCLEKLLDTGKTLCDITAGNTAGMEGTHGQLCTRLTDGLRRDDSDRFADLYCFACRHVRAIASCTDTVAGTAGEDRTDLDPLKRLTVFIHTVADNAGCTLRRDHMVCLYDHISVFVLQCIAGETSCDTILQALDLLFSVGKRLYPHTRDFVFSFRTVYLTDDQLLRNVYQTSGQVTGIGGTKRGIGQTFTGTVRGHKVLQYVQTFTEVGLDRKFDGVTGRIGHQTTHTGQLLDLFVGTTGSGIGHHEDVVIFIQSGEQCMGQFIVGLLPGVNDLFVTLFVCDQTTFEVLGNLVYRLLCLRDHLRLLRRNGHIGNGYGHRRTGRILVTGGLDVIQNLCSLGRTVCIDDFFQDLFQLFLCYQEIYLQSKLIARDGTVYIAKILRQDLIEQETAQGGCYVLGQRRSIRHFLAAAHMDLGLQCDITVFICQDRFVDILEETSLSLAAGALLGQIVDTEDHIL